jgi:hypothetical protein
VRVSVKLFSSRSFQSFKAINSERRFMGRMIRWHGWGRSRLVNGQSTATPGAVNWTLNPENLKLFAPPRASTCGRTAVRLRPA